MVATAFLTCLKGHQSRYAVSKKSQADLAIQSALTDLYIKFNNDEPFQPQAGAGSVQPELDSVVAADGTFTIEANHNGGGPVGWNLRFLRH